jgi:hypothetical protein
MQEGIKREEWNIGMMEDREPKQAPQRNREMMEARGDLSSLFFEEPNIPIFHYSNLLRSRAPMFQYSIVQGITFGGLE